MEFFILTLVEHNTKEKHSFWAGRDLLPEELLPLEQLKKAAQKAASISPVFFDRVYIVDKMPWYQFYAPFRADSQESVLWIHEGFLREGVAKFTLDELVPTFLHEAAHYIQYKLPQTFKQILANDSAWTKTLAHYPEISIHKRRFIEATADIYALKIAGESAITNLDKVYLHVCNYMGWPYIKGTFGETPSNISLLKRFEIQEYYLHQRNLLKEKSFLRMPLSAKRLDTDYQTTESTSDEELRSDGRQSYFEWVAKGENGYDFLESLLKLHPGVHILPHWGGVSPDEEESATRQKSIGQFIHDVTTLMKLLLGSANLYVNDYGEFLPGELPYGAVRSNRSGLTRTVLHENGSIRRIAAELVHCNLEESSINQLLQDLHRLHQYIQFPSFEQQRDDIQNLPKSRKSGKNL